MSEPIHCPAHITFLLHCHVSPDGFEHIDAPVFQQLIPSWLKLGVIEPHEPFGATPCTPHHYRTTALGKAWVQALCNVTCPKTAFIDEQGRVL